MVDNGWIDKFRKQGKRWEPRFSEAAAVLGDLIEDRMDEDILIENLDAISHLISFSLHYDQLQDSAARATIAVRHYLPLAPLSDLRGLQRTLETEISYLQSESKDIKRDIDVRKAYLLVCMTLRQPNLAKAEVRALEDYIANSESVGHVMEAFFDVFNVWLYDHERVIGEDWYEILERAVSNVGEEHLILRTYHILTIWAVNRLDTKRALRYASMLYSAARINGDDNLMYAAAAYLASVYQRTRKLVFSAFWLQRVRRGAQNIHPASGVLIEAGHLLMADRFEAAAALYRHALLQLNADRHNPMFQRNIPYLEARALVDLGYTLGWLKKYEEAEEKIMQGVKIHRKHHDDYHVADARYKLAILLAHQRKRDEALWALSEAAELSYAIENPEYRAVLLDRITDTRRRIEERGEIGPELHATKKTT